MSVGAYSKDGPVFHAHAPTQALSHEGRECAPLATFPLWGGLGGTVVACCILIDVLRFADKENDH